MKEQIKIKKTDKIKALELSNGDVITHLIEFDNEHYILTIENRISDESVIYDFLDKLKSSLK